MLIGHLYVFLIDIFPKVFCPFFDWVVFLLLSCMSCLYILEIKPLLVTSFANTFSQSIGCLFGPPIPTQQHAGSWFSDQGLNPCPLQWKHGVLTTGPPHKSLSFRGFFVCRFLKIVYFWLHWVFVAAHRLSLVAASRGTLVAARGPLIAVASLVAEHGL